jgi:hypothetical protein
MIFARGSGWASRLLSGDVDDFKAKTTSDWISDYAAFTSVQIRSRSL